MKSRAEIIAINKGNNAIRAMRAKNAVDAYVSVLDGERAIDDSDSLAEAICDLFGDLMHLCDVSGLQFEDCVETGRSNYAGERNLDEFERGVCEDGGLG